MESDHFFASIGVQFKGPNSSSQKDVGIFRHQWQPLALQEQAFKKSATLPNSLAATQAHIFAAQADKAVVNVYSTERNNQEAIVPFPERISALTLAADNCVLILGSAEGRIFLWEVGQQLHILRYSTDMDSYSLVASSLLLSHIYKP